MSLIEIYLELACSILAGYVLFLHYDTWRARRRR